MKTPERGGYRLVMPTVKFTEQDGGYLMSVWLTYDYWYNGAHQKFAEWVPLTVVNRKYDSFEQWQREAN